MNTITLLLVEDEAIIALNEKRFLENAGYHVLLAYSGEKAVETAREKPEIRLVLMDLDLGSGINGAEAAERILEIRNVPVVFLTSHAEREYVDWVKGVSRYGYVLKSSGEQIILDVVERALELFASHEACRRLEARVEEMEAEKRWRQREYELLFHSSKDALFIVSITEDGCFRYARNNKAHQASTGIPFRDLVGKTPVDLMGEDAGTLVESNYRRCLTEGRAITYEEELDLPAGRRSFLTTLTPIKREGKVSYIVGSAKDITNRKEAERKQREFAERLELTVLAAEMAWWEMDLVTHDVTFHPRKAEMLGYGPEEFAAYEDFIALLHDEDRDATIEAMRKHLAGETERYDVEYRIRCKSGGYRCFRDMGVIVSRDRNGTPVKVAGIVQDITEPKRSKRRVEALLKEKEFILREVHHRIKNNMSTMMSLLSLEAREVDNPQAAGVLNDAVSRLQSMQVLYEKLYRSGDYQAVEAEEYLPTLAQQVVDLFPETETMIRLETSVASFRLDTKSVSTLGIIITELITNAVKYAFAEKSVGSIFLEAETTESEVVVRLSDDGRGLPESFDLEENEGFGLTLVRELTAQLGGEVAISGTPGASFEIRFPQPADSSDPITARDPSRSEFLEESALQ